MAKRKKKKPKVIEDRTVIVQGRPDGAGPGWWPRFEDELAFVVLDPYDPPSWSISVADDEEYQINSVHLWKETELELPEFIEHLKSEWMEEHGPEDAEEGEEIYEWEFQVVSLEEESDQCATSGSSCRSG